jgi:hypothetical protein
MSFVIFALVILESPSYSSNLAMPFVLTNPSVFVGMLASTIPGNNGSNHRPTDSRLVGRSHFTADGLLFPVRPRSSPQIRRPPRVQIQAEDSDSDT